MLDGDGEASMDNSTSCDRKVFSSLCQKRLVKEMQTVKTIPHRKKSQAHSQKEKTKQNNTAFLERRSFKTSKIAAYCTLK